MRLLVTMDMPAFAHRSKFGPVGDNAGFPHLSLPGFRNESPIFIGCVRQISQEQRERWLQTVETIAASRKRHARRGWN
jgi:putative NADPH-quinone reductase